MNTRRSITIFLIFSVIGMMAAFFYSNNTASLSEVASQINLTYLLLCLIGVPLFDWTVAGLRMYVFSSALNSKISLMACVKNCAIGSFMNSVTPSQTGGGIAQVWVLTQEGARTGQAITIMLMTFITTNVVFLLTAIGLWIFSDSIVFPTTVHSSVFATAVAIFALVAGSLLGAFLYPNVVIGWSNRLVVRVEKYPRLVGPINRFVTWLQESSIASETVLKKHKIRFFIATVLSALIFSNKFVAGYLAAQALGIDVSLVQVLIIQMFLTILLYFMPTPGGAGGAEIGATMLMASLIPASFLAPYTIIWRSALAYMAVIVGGILFIRYLHKAGVSDIKQADLQTQ